MSGSYILTNPIKYAVMVPFDNEGYLYITKPTGEIYEVTPVLHDTYEIALEAAKIWGKFARIVEYTEESIKGE
jgi:hypothetical protein